MAVTVVVTAERAGPPREPGPFACPSLTQRPTRLD